MTPEAATPCRFLVDFRQNCCVVPWVVNQHDLGKFCHESPKIPRGKTSDSFAKSTLLLSPQLLDCKQLSVSISGFLVGGDWISYDLLIYTQPFDLFGGGDKLIRSQHDLPPAPHISGAWQFLFQLGKSHFFGCHRMKLQSLNNIDGHFQPVKELLKLAFQRSSPDRWELQQILVPWNFAKWPFFYCQRNLQWDKFSRTNFGRHKDSLIFGCSGFFGDQSHCNAFFTPWLLSSNMQPVGKSILKNLWVFVFLLGPPNNQTFLFFYPFT